ncbi:hypothetical protein PVAND_017006 [Polypedilum vanderplanki]|uniref:Uncharacterized protein n=1 Tax=Polypedilum vanderplanki TaxID=319348 RepID=A0A9J6BH19_POLVA|nr:hypothetical protein PVAND_017006 [Polypedilum vanderplanki]
MLTVWIGVLVLCGFSAAQNCVFAPNCPDFVIWSPGYICDDGFFAVIKKKVINGRQVKTVCCSEVTSCSPNQFWCSSQENNEVYSTNSAALAPSCLNGCVAEFRKFIGDNAPMIDGVSAGFYDANTESFIGRVRVFNTYQPGRIVANTAGIFYTYHGIERFSNESVEYLVRNPNYNYEWTPSANGTVVINAVTLNIPRSSSQYVGRIHVGNYCRIGAVVRIMGGLFYGDDHGSEEFTNQYEVLTCKTKPVTTTISPPPICPIYWKSHSMYSSMVNNNQSVIINAQNGFLIGEASNNYAWFNFTSLTDSEVPATLIIPGGIQHNIGRAFIDGNLIIGTVDINTGILQYTDGHGNMQNILCYEVLVCCITNNVNNTTVIGTTTTSSTITFNHTSSTTISSESTTTSYVIHTSSSTTVSGQSTSSTTPSGHDSSSTTPFGQSTSSTTPSGQSTSSTTPSGQSTSSTTPSGQSTSSTTPSGQSTSSTTPSGQSTSSTTPSGHDSTQQRLLDMIQAQQRLLDKAQVQQRLLDKAQAQFWTKHNSTTPSGHDSSSTTPSGHDSSSTTPSGHDSSSTTPSGHDSSSTTPSGHDSSSTTPSGHDSSSTTPSGQSTSSTTPSGQSTSSTTPSGQSTSSTTPSGQSTSSTTPSGQSTSSTTPSTLLTTTSSTMSTTTVPQNCVVSWKDYTGIEDLPHVAVTSGIPSTTGAYVGQSNVYGNLLPGRISFNTTTNSYCFYFGLESCINSFQYLENNHNYTYSWVNSQNGDSVMNAIVVQTFYIGKIFVNGTLYFGTIVPGYGMMYVEDSSSKWHYSNNSYQVLACIASPPPQIYECSQQWNSYNGNSAPLQNGISVEDGTNATFVGRGTFLSDFTIGKIQIPPLQPGLLYYSFGNLALDLTTAEYLVQNPQYSYTWVESSFGLPVEYALAVRKSSAYWPMYIGRVQINSTFVLMGKVLPSKGMTYYDANGNEQIFSHYQVLTCTSPTVVCNSNCARLYG